MENSTTSYRIEQRFTSATVHEFLAKTQYKVVSNPAAGDAVLQCEDLLDHAVILRGPQVLIRRGVNQLRRDPQLITRAHHRSLDDRLHAQGARDLRYRLAGSAIADDRGAGDHPQAVQLRELRDQRLGYTIGEIVLLRISADIGKREHCDG